MSAIAVITTGMLIAATASGASSAASGSAAYKAVVIKEYTFDPNVRTLTVKVATYGWKMYPGLVGAKANKPDGGHWLLYVNGKVAARSATKSASVKNLPHGPIHVFAALANNDNSAVKGATRSDPFTEVVK